MVGASHCTNCMQAHPTVTQGAPQQTYAPPQQWSDPQAPQWGHPAPAGQWSWQPEHYKPAVPRRVFRLPDTPLVHLGIGLAIVAVFALSAVPAIVTERGRVPCDIGDVLVRPEGETLWILFSVIDEEGKEMAAPGRAEVTIFEAGADTLGLEFGGPTLARFSVDVPMERFETVQVLPTMETLLACRMKGIRYDITPQLRLASERMASIRADIVLHTESGPVVRGRSELDTLGDLYDLLDLPTY